MSQRGRRRTRGRHNVVVGVAVDVALGSTVFMLNANDPLLPRPVHAATRELEKLVELTGELPTVRLRIVTLTPDDDERHRPRAHDDDAAARE